MKQYTLHNSYNEKSCSNTKKDENVSNTCKILQIITIQMAPNLGSLYYFYKNILNCKIINFYHPKGRNSRIDAKFKFISKLHRHIVQCR